MTINTLRMFKARPWACLSLCYGFFLAAGSLCQAKPAHVKLARAPVSRAYIEQAIRDAALKEDVPYLLLKAICAAESDLNPRAYVYNDGGAGNHSLGLCQVLRETGDTLVGSDRGCRADFRPGSGRKRSPANCKLFGPRVNALAAARYLKSQLERYDGDLQKATAAYNTGSLKTCSATGQVKARNGTHLYPCTPGQLLNQRYVDRVDSFVVKFSLTEGISCSRRIQ